MLFEPFHDLRHGGFFLADGDINALDAGVFLANDGIHANGRLADLAVADDQFTLAASNRGHGIDSLEARVHRLIDRLALNHAGGDHFNAAELRGFNRAFAVQGGACRVNHAAQKRFTDRNLGNLAGSFDDIPFFDVGHFAENGNTDIVRFEVEHHAEDAAGELQKLHGHGILHAVHSGDAVTDGQDGSGFAYIQLFFVAFDLLRNNLTDFFRLDGFHVLSCLP